MVFDAENIPMEEYLMDKDSKTFRSALCICLYIAQERLDIQQSVRVLASYMGRPTKTVLCALRKLGSYLVQTQDMKMHYPRAELYSSTLTRWNGVDERREGKPFELELFSDSDWASCRVTRRSTSSGLVFLNGCCIHSHSRAQASISLSSMEAEILAATGLLVEGIMVKQFLQFLLGDERGLENNNQVQMRLWLDSTSAQAFFNRLGPGRAKHLSTRILWSQQAMRKKWFVVERVSTKENPADLNTKPLSRERREFLLKKIGMVSESFNDDENGNGRNNTKMKAVVRAITAMLMTTSLQGCNGATWTSSMATNPMSWTMATWWTLTTVLFVTLVVYLMNKLKETNAELEKYKIVWKEVQRTLSRQGRNEPSVETDPEDVIPDARREPFSGVWYGNEEGEEEEQTTDAMVDNHDREATPRPRARIAQNGLHGACDGDEPERDGEGETGEAVETAVTEPNPESGTVPESEPTGTSMPSMEDGGIEELVDVIAEIAEAGEGRSRGSESDDDGWMDEEESPQERYRRYVQSGQDEVSDPDDWAQIHYGPYTPASSSRRERSRSREPSTPSTPMPRAMPKILADRRNQRIAGEEGEAMVRRAEAADERQGVRQFQAGGKRGSKGGPNISASATASDNENYFQDSYNMARYINIGMVPRDAPNFDDWRWDLIMQGVGPETILVHNCRDLNRIIYETVDPIHRLAMQRLLRNLHGLMVEFQSKEPLRWIDAAYRLKDWLEADRDWSFFDEASTGSEGEPDRHEEDEEEEDDDVDPQDFPDEGAGDRHGPGGTEPGREGDMASSGHDY